MSDTEDKSEPVLKNLTQEEQRVLAAALKQVERDVLERTVKTIRNWVMLAAAVVTVFGVVSIATIKSAVVSGAANHLSQDAKLKERVIKESAANLESATNLVEKAQQLSEDIDRESARVSAGITTQLDELHAMIDRVRQDIESITDTEKDVP